MLDDFGSLHPMMLALEVSGIEGKGRGRSKGSQTRGATFAAISSSKARMFFCCVGLGGRSARLRPRTQPISPSSPSNPTSMSRRISLRTSWISRRRSFRRRSMSLGVRAGMGIPWAGDLPPRSPCALGRRESVGLASLISTSGRSI